MNGQTQVSVNPPHTPFPLKKQKNKVRKRITDCYFLTKLTISTSTVDETSFYFTIVCWKINLLLIENGEKLWNAKVQAQKFNKQPILIE